MAEDREGPTYYTAGPQMTLNDVVMNLGKNPSLDGILLDKASATFVQQNLFLRYSETMNGVDPVPVRILCGSPVIYPLCPSINVWMIYCSFRSDVTKEVNSRKRKSSEMEADNLQVDKEKLASKLEKIELDYQLSQDELQSAYVPLSFLSSFNSTTN